MTEKITQEETVKDVGASAEVGTDPETGETHSKVEKTEQVERKTTAEITED